MLRDVIEQEVKKLLRFTRPSGPNNLGGPCPFHKGGQEKTPSFYINLNNGLFYCHSCGKTGNFPQFLKLMGVHSAKVELIQELAKKEHVEKPIKAIDHRSNWTISEAILGALDYCPKGLVADGFDPKLLHKLDVGFDKEAKRITFPIRDLYGNLVGISGRTVTDAFPRYLVYRDKDLKRFAPADNKNKYKGYSIKNHDFLWNMHNVYPSLFYTDLDTVILVEGYKACIWMIQNGFDNTVALMGSRMTYRQEALLTKFTGSIFIFLDKNKAGIQGTLDTGIRLIQKGQRVWVVRYPQDSEDGTQPDNLDQNEIQQALDTAYTFNDWREAYGLLGRPSQIVRAKIDQLRNWERKSGRGRGLQEGSWP